MTSGRNAPGKNGLTDCNLVSPSTIILSQIAYPGRSGRGFCRAGDDSYAAISLTLLLACRHGVADSRLADELDRRAPRNIAQLDGSRLRLDVLDRVIRLNGLWR